MADIKDILDEIYPRINKLDFFSELNPERKGYHYVASCPQCNHKSAYIYETGIYLNCNRLNNCSYSESMWSYLQRNRGFSNKDTLLELARIANYKLKTDEFNEESYKKKKELGDIFEKALNYMKKMLWSAQGQETLSYLKNRGYKDEEILQAELGFFPDYEELKEYLLKNDLSESEIKNIGLNTKGLGKTHTLAIPYRDMSGMLKGFIVRSLLSNEELEKIGEQKYKYNYGVEKDTLFNLHQARNQKELILVEGYLDCLIANAKGIKGLVGTGGNHLTEKQLENALKYGYKKFNITLDNDKAGKSGTEKAIKLISKRDLKAFVVTLPEGYKDPDEIIRTQGKEFFENLVKKAVSGTKWLAEYLVVKHNKFETDKDRESAIEEAIQYAETLYDPLQAHDYLNKVTELLDIPPEFFDLKFEQYKEKVHKQKTEISYKELIKEAAKIIDAGKIEETELFINTRLDEIKSGSVKKVIKPYTLEDLQIDLENTQEGLKTGFTNLDRLLLIPQEAITIVAGRPSHGKTTFLLNIFVNMLKKYPDKVFLFFSYEETKKQLTLKILNILSERVQNEKRNLQELESYLKNKERLKIPEIEKAKELLKNYTEDSRMWIIDEPFQVEQMVNQIAYFKERYNIGAVFIDYIQKIKLKGKYGTRQIELQKVSESILEAAKKYSIPIILGAQLGRDKDSKNKIRLDNLREAGDIENDANLVIAINNEAMDKAQSENKKLTDRKVNIKIHILKNRNGAVNEEIDFVFDRPILKMYEDVTKQNNW